MEDWKKDKKLILEMIALTIFLIAQIILFIVFLNYGRIIFLKCLGYFCWALSIIFGWLPIYELRRKGGVPKGSSYVSTTKLVTTGIYGIIRHPQFLGGMLISVAFALISQHWSVFLLALPIIAILYKDVLRADVLGIEKFGTPYRDYIKKVPRMNFVLGLIKKFIK